MCSARSAWSRRPGGLPHSGILGLTFALNYPRLIAEFYALHRLLVPRHPPCALCSLTHLSALLNAVSGRVAASGLSSRWVNTRDLHWLPYIPLFALRLSRYVSWITVGH